MMVPKNLRVSWRKWILVPPVLAVAIYACLPNSYEGLLPYLAVFLMVSIAVPVMVAEVMEDSRLETWLNTLSSNQIIELMDDQLGKGNPLNLLVLLAARRRALGREAAPLVSVSHSGTQEI